MGFSTAQGSTYTAHTQCVLKIENFVSCDMSLICDQMEEVLEQTAQITSRRSFLGVLKLPFASKLAIERKFSCDPACTCWPKCTYTFWSYSCSSPEVSGSEVGILELDWCVERGVYVGAIYWRRIDANPVPYARTLDTRPCHVHPVVSLAFCQMGDFLWGR